MGPPRLGVAPGAAARRTGLLGPALRLRTVRRWQPLTQEHASPADQPEDRRDCYWLYIVTHCATAPQLQNPIKDPARFAWHQVKKVERYWLEVDVLTEPS